MKPRKFRTTLITAFIIVIVLNFLVRVADPSTGQSSGIITDYIKNHGFFKSICFFILCVLLAGFGDHIYGLIRALFMPRVMGFWRVVTKYPDLAYNWFKKSPAWEVRDFPLSHTYQQEFPEETWAGPFDLFVPCIQKRVCIFGKVGEYEQTRKSFVQNAMTLEKTARLAMNSK